LMKNVRPKERLKFTEKALFGGKSIAFPHQDCNFI